MLYPRLALVACIDPRSIRVRLCGNERKIRISSLGETEHIEVELGKSTDSSAASVLFPLAGEFDLPQGFDWCQVTKSGSGSPTSVELMQDV